MATASTAVPTVDKTRTDVSQRHVTYFGTLAVGAAPLAYKTAGIVMDFASKVPHKTVPVEVEVWSESMANVYHMRYIRGTTISNGKLACAAGATNVELADDSAIDATLSGDTKLYFRATWKKGQ